VQLTQLSALPSVPIQFYTTANYPCSYLPDRVARSQVACVPAGQAPAVYTSLVQMGFRRSGMHMYRPHCDGCRACTSIRVPVSQFAPTRSQRRAWHQHHRLDVVLRPCTFDHEHFELYCRYQRARHAGGGMDLGEAQHYRDYLVQSPVKSWMLEFREPAGPSPNRLMMVAVVDELNDGLSAVYIFYDPDPKLSLGTFGVLWQIQWARQMELDYVYPGYWIADSAKMAYKQNFRPHQIYQSGSWASP
jgi:arginine-tRNA-protein transferase